jgi:hypothetical protein
MASRRAWYMAKPPAASSRAGVSTSRKESVPNAARAVTQASKAAGTHAGRKPLPGMRSMPAARNQAMVARAGAVPMPLMASTRQAQGS